MWVVIIYALVWLVSAAVAVSVYLGGFLGEMLQVIFGFYLSTLFIAGFVLVLPAWLNEYFAPKY